MVETEALKEQKELVGACLAGNKKAMTKFYEKFAPVMFGICLRYSSNRDDAKDLLHDGFIKIFGSLGQFRNEGSLEGWIKRIFINLALENIRKQKIKWLEDEYDKVLEVSDTNYSIFEKIEQTEVLLEIQLLAPGYRTVLNLYAIEGYTHEEISNMLGISINTSKTQLFRARKILIERLRNNK